jgi:flavin reductase
VTQQQVRRVRVRDGEPFAELRETAARFATGVGVLTTEVDHVPMGMTINSFTMVSLEPQLLLVCLHRLSRLVPAIRKAGVFAVTILAADQCGVARRFASPGRPVGDICFAGIPTHGDRATGCPILSEGVAYFGCAIDRAELVGDHVVIIGEIVSYGLLRPAPLLLFADGCYTELETAVEEAHAARQR